MAIDDKRKQQRKSLHGEALVADVLGNTWTKVDLLDISPSGLAFLSTEEFAGGSARTLRFFLPENPQRISVVCHIVHCAAHSYLQGYRIGAEFVRMHEDDLQAVTLFCAGLGA